jgi:hypothetical protein
MSSRHSTKKEWRKLINGGCRKVEAVDKHFGVAGRWCRRFCSNVREHAAVVQNYCLGLKLEADESVVSA